MEGTAREMCPVLCRGGAGPLLHQVAGRLSLQVHLRAWTHPGLLPLGHQPQRQMEAASLLLRELALLAEGACGFPLSVPA